MTKLYLIVFLLCLSGVVISQTNKKQNQSLYISGGQSFTGSGDLSGFYLLNGFSKDYSNWNLCFELAITQYNGSDELFFTAPNRPNEVVDGSIRYNIDGIQINFIGSRRIVKSLEHRFDLGIGPILRYQSSSIPDSYTVLYPAITGLPVPVLYFQNQTKQNTIAFGGIFKAVYKYRVSSKIDLGINFSFQTDTNGDNISNAGISVGYSL